MSFIEKKAQRLDAKQRRERFFNSLSHAEKQQIGQDLCNQFCRAFPPSPSMKVAAYWPLSHEADTRPLLTHLHRHKIPIALPQAKPKKALSFYSWAPNQPLVTGPFQVQEPSQSSQSSRPEDLLSFSHILIPLLAFDDSGNRLGYGQGHYDRTLAILAEKGLPLSSSEPLKPSLEPRSPSSEPRKSPLLVGYAFACQQFDQVTIDPHDQALDLIITEKLIIYPFNLKMRRF